MKKILLILFVLFSVHSFGQVTESVTFDFTNPTSLNPSVSMADGVFEKNVFSTVFTNGPVSITFTDYGQGVVLNRSTIDYVCTLSLRQRASMTISISGTGYALSSINLTGSVGTIKEVSSSTKSWYAPDGTTKSITLHNGTEETFIQKIKVNYTRAAKQVNFIGVNFDTTEPISSFKSKELEFDQDITNVTSQSVKLYQLSSKNGKRLDDAVSDIVATISETNPKKVVVALKNNAEIKVDSYYELYVPAGTFKSVENSSNLEISVKFEISADRAVFNYDTALSPDPKEGTYPEFPTPIKLTYDRNAYVSEDNTAKVYPTNDPSNFYPLSLSAEGHNIIIDYSDDPLPEGDYTVEIARGSINNGFNASSPDYHYNPKITLHYTIENENKTLLATATALLGQGGVEKALLGYPSDDSKGRLALLAVLEKGTSATVAELKAAIEAYKAETAVRLPEAEKWYTMAAVNKNKEALYLRYYDGNIQLTSQKNNASSFKAVKNGNALSFATADGKYFHVKDVAEDETTQLNLSAESAVYGLTIERMNVDGEQYGLLTLKDGNYAAVAFGTVNLTPASGNQVQFGEQISSGFSFTESEPEQNMVHPAVSFVENSVSRAGISLVLVVENVDDAILNGNAAPYFTKDGSKVDFDGTILTKSQDHHTQFFVNTTGLTSGNYTLVLPKGTFTCYKDGILAADIDLSCSFRVGSSSEDNLTGFVEDFHFICYQTQIRTSISSIKDKDLEELYLFSYGNEEIGGIYADPTQPVYIVQAQTDGAIAKGHFEPYPTFSEDTGFENNVMAIKLVMDEPLQEGGLSNAAGYYGYKILAGTVGDRNFKRYLEGDPTVSKSDCHVNKLDYSITFYVDNAAATTQYPSSDVLTEARRLLEKTGVGYPAENSASRSVLKRKTEYIVGDDEEYKGYINDFYNEENVEKPVAGKYYKVYAIDDDGWKAYLSFDGTYVGITSDATKATGLKMVANTNGSYSFVTGNGLYMKQLSNEFNTSSYYDASDNDITLKKLKIDGVDAKKTFGLFSMKIGNTYAFVDVKDSKIIEAESELADFNSEKTCAFMFEEVAQADIPVPAFEPVLSPESGSEVSNLDELRIICVGTGDVTVVDQSLIKLTSTKGTVYHPTEVNVRSNRIELKFPELEVGLTYFLNIAKGAFTYKFAELPQTIEQIDAIYTIVPTGISSVSIDELDGSIYDLQGRKVEGTNLKSGIYIKNGKKVYIK